jgi:hypothetical protein
VAPPLWAPGVVPPAAISLLRIPVSQMSAKGAGVDGALRRERTGVCMRAVSGLWTAPGRPTRNRITLARPEHGRLDCERAAGARPCVAKRRGDRAHYAWLMCRNIRTLYNYDPPATKDEVRAAALQYVRKISGFSKPSRANEEAFAQAIDEVTAASIRLLSSLQTAAAPKNREAEAAKARARSAERYAV